MQQVTYDIWFQLRAFYKGDEECFVVERVVEFSKPASYGPGATVFGYDILYFNAGSDSTIVAAIYEIGDHLCKYQLEGINEVFIKNKDESLYWSMIWNRGSYLGFGIPLLILAGIGSLIGILAMFYRLYNPIISHFRMMSKADSVIDKIEISLLKESKT